MQQNPVGWFEIYVSDMARARAFYETVLSIELENMSMEGVEMWGFPGDMQASGASGALVKMDGFEPGAGGTMVYFVCDDCAVEAERASQNGGQVVQEKMSIGEHGFVAMFLDTEGNLVGLHSMS